MTQPRERHPGAYYHVVRRVHRREFRLRPNDDLNGAVACLVQDANEITGIQVIAMCVMSNHVHFLLYDPEGWVSAWMTHVHGTLARYLNRIHGTRSHVWDSSELKEQRLGDIQTVARVAAYICCNPVAAGLVNSPSAWPGICTTLREIASGRGPIYERPSSFFRKNGPVCESAMVSHECPPHTTPRRFRAMVRKELGELLRAARAKVKGAGRSFLGAEAATTVDPFASPITPSSASIEPKAKVVHRLLASTRGRRLALVKQQAEFRSAYANARWRLRLNANYDDYAKHVQAIWPAGTWYQWRFYGARRKPMLKCGILAIP